MLGNMLSFIGLVLFTSEAGLLFFNALYGATYAMIVVMGSPFLMDNSRPAERQHLFSIYSAVTAGSGMLGGFIGGGLGGKETGPVLERGRHVCLDLVPVALDVKANHGTPHFDAEFLPDRNAARTSVKAGPDECGGHRADADAFWGPSVHWNRHLGRYVMLLNRAIDKDWTQEGIYVSYSRALDNPRGWSQPVKIMDAPSKPGWYPQVIGIDKGESDKVAGRRARLFVHGISRWEIEFRNPGER